MRDYWFCQLRAHLEAASLRAHHQQTVESNATNINPYLVDADNILLAKRTKPLGPSVPEMDYGSMPNDDGALLIETAEDRQEILRRDPDAKPFIKKFFQVDEFLYNKKRWCLSLDDVSPEYLGRFSLFESELTCAKPTAQRATAPPPTA